MLLAVLGQLATCADISTIVASPGDGHSILISFELVEGAFDGETPLYAEFRSEFFCGETNYYLLTRKVFYE